MATKKETEEKHNQAKEKAQTETPSSKAVAGEPQAEFDVSQEINELLQALEGDLSVIEAESALSLVEQWYGFLHKSKEPEVKQLASGLKELQKLLKSGKATGHEISEELIHIGEQTTEFSSDAEKGLKQPVQRLGKQLRKAGTSIAKAEDQEYHQQIDTLVEKAEGEELTSLSVEEAVGAIDFWYNLLHKAEGEQFQQVANSLKELKQVLKRGNAKSETVAKALTHVGEQTAEAASEAPRGFKGVLQNLGKQLTKVGESLTATK
jgi:predicted RND superfamily exporter protein